MYGKLNSQLIALAVFQTAVFQSVVLAAETGWWDPEHIFQW